MYSTVFPISMSEYVLLFTLQFSRHLLYLRVKSLFTVSHFAHDFNNYFVIIRYLKPLFVFKSQPLLFFTTAVFKGIV
jgi:hypothetical protein